jgi:hypothetical protein
LVRRFPDDHALTLSGSAIINANAAYISGNYNHERACRARDGSVSKVPAWHFRAQIPDTETQLYLRNAAVWRGLAYSMRVRRLKPDWMAGAAGFETLHFE